MAEASLAEDRGDTQARRAAQLEALRQALAAEPPLPFDELAARMRAITAGRKHTPAEVLLRESRDER